MVKKRAEFYVSIYYCNTFCIHIKQTFMKYNKQPLTIKKQITLLEKRGLAIPDKSRAERLLTNISYYRLSAYMLPFKPNKILDDERFSTGTTWDDVYNLYVFDRKLRLLMPLKGLKLAFVRN